MQARILGPFRLGEGGRRITIGRFRQRAVPARLGTSGSWQLAPGGGLSGFRPPATPDYGRLLVQHAGHRAATARGQRPASHLDDRRADPACPRPAHPARRGHRLVNTRLLKVSRSTICTYVPGLKTGDRQAIEARTRAELENPQVIPGSADSLRLAVAIAVPGNRQ